MKPHRGTLILVFGILGILSCFPLGIAAWIMGKRDLKEMDAGTMDPSGRGNTNVGRICGMIGSLLAGVAITLCLAGLIVAFLRWSDIGRTETYREDIPAAGAPAQMEKAVPGRTNTVGEKPPQQP